MKICDRHTLILCASLLGASTFGAFANEPVQRTNTTTLWFEGWGPLTNATLKVSGPDGIYKEVFVERGAPKFSLRDIRPVSDGVYNYSLTAATTEKVKIRNPMNNGRGEAAKTESFKPFSMQGRFFVQRGVIVTPKEIKEE